MKKCSILEEDISYLTGVLAGVRTLSESLEVLTNSGYEVTSDLINLITEQTLSNIKLKIKQAQDMKSKHDTPLKRPLGIMEIFIDPYNSAEQLQCARDFVDLYKSAEQLQCVRDFILADYLLNKIKNEREY